jgi:4'-phosphopantetheinyl transferase
VSTAPPSCRYLTARLEDVPSSLDWLSPREQETVERLHVAKRRHDWLLGRWTAKQAVAALLVPTARPPELRMIEILAAPDGAPEVFVGTVSAPWSISISHSAGRALCAVVPRGVAVGCDVEHVAPRDERMVEDFFAPDEVATVRRCDGRARDLLVTLVWSAKESALKLLREGLRLDTRSARVDLDDAPASTEAWTPLTVRCTDRADAMRGWWRTAADDVLTVVTGMPGAPPLEIVVAEEAR